MKAPNFFDKPDSHKADIQALKLELSHVELDLDIANEVYGCWDCGWQGTDEEKYKCHSNRAMTAVCPNCDSEEFYLIEE